MDSKLHRVMFDIKSTAQHRENGKEVAIISSNVISDNKEVCYLYTEGNQLFVTPADKFILEYKLIPVIE